LKKASVVVGVVAAFLAGVLFSSHFLQPDAKTPLIVAEAVEQPVIVQDHASKSSTEIHVGSAPDIAAEEDGVRSSVGSFESQSVKYNAINFEFVLQTDHLEDNFSRLAEEFRISGSAEGGKKRDKFQQFFYAQDALLKGQVSLDVLECGDQLCVAELRGVDASALKSFMDGKIAWDAFESKAIIEAPTQQPNIGRLIFSHDPEIKGITMPPFGD